MQKCLSKYWTKSVFINLHCSSFNLYDNQYTQPLEFRQTNSACLNSCILCNFTIFWFRSWTYEAPKLICHVPKVRLCSQVFFGIKKVKFWFFARYFCPAERGNIIQILLICGNWVNLAAGTWPSDAPVKIVLFHGIFSLVL